MPEAVATSDPPERGPDHGPLYTETPAELKIGQPFPGVGDDGNLTLTLGSHDFFWLRVRSAASNPASPFTQAMPILSIEG